MSPGNRREREQIRPGMLLVGAAAILAGCGSSAAVLTSSPTKPPNAPTLGTAVSAPPSSSTTTTPTSGTTATTPTTAPSHSSSSSSRSSSSSPVRSASGPVRTTTTTTAPLTVVTAPPTTAPATTSTTDNIPAPGSTTIVAITSRYGPILANSSGKALYLFTPDSPTFSDCTSFLCVGVWPPVVAHGGGFAGAGVNQAYLGTLVRPNGQVQVTYGGHPLYTYAGDAKANEETGQGINSFGGHWYVVSASTGQAIT